jgi:hypothetical protein
MLERSSIRLGNSQ